MLPIDLIENPLELRSVSGVDELHPSDLALQKFAEKWVGIAILRSGAGALAVGEDGFELIELAAIDVWLFVDDQTRRYLPLASPLHTRFTVIRMESFFEDDRSDLGFKTQGLAGKFGTPRKKEVVGVAGIVRASSARETGETTIETEGAKIGESRRSRCALRKVRQ